MPAPIEPLAAAPSLPGTTVKGPAIQSSSYSFWNIIVVSMFAYAVYRIAVRFFEQKRREIFGTKYREKDFADGFL
jgi:hypothetical protein